MRSDLIRLVGAPKQSLRVIKIYYSFKYSLRIKISLLESLRSQNTYFRAHLGKTSYKDLVFARGEILSLVGAQNESLSIITMYYIKYRFWT